jgi:ABC-type antimicrobial peptide transport system permease subunit
MPIAQVNTLEEMLRAGAIFFNVFGVMFTVFGAAALFLASVGLYGVLSFSVNQRTHELGLRVALGATPKRVVRLVLRQAAFQLGVGMVLGMGLSLLLGQGLSFILFDVAAAHPGVLAGVGVLLAFTGILACFVPASRATRVDPAEAMRLRG